MNYKVKADNVKQVSVEYQFKKQQYFISITTKRKEHKYYIYPDSNIDIVSFYIASNMLDCEAGYVFVSLFNTFVFITYSNFDGSKEWLIKFIDLITPCKRKS